MKQKPTIQFDPHDYDYLDALDKDGWHWEFTRRNENYRTAYAEMERLRKEGEDYCKNRHRIVSQAYYVQDKFQINPFIKTPLGSKMPDPCIKYSDLPSRVKPVTLVRPITPMKTFTEKGLQAAIRKTWEVNKNLFAQIGQCNFPTYVMSDFVKDILSPNPEAPNNTNDPEFTIFIGISTHATREELRKAFEDVLKKYVRPKIKCGDKKQTPDKWKSGLMIWDLRIFKNTCGDVAPILGIPKDTVKKQFFKVCELIYDLPYKEIEHRLKYPETREEDLQRYCNNCSKKPGCKEPCPDKIALAVYDITRYQREQLFGDIEILQKYAQENSNPSAYEDELIDAIDKRASLKKQ